MMIMKLFAHSLALGLILARSSTASSTSADPCCLCNGCADVDPGKVDLLTLSPFHQHEHPTTCDEIALELLDRRVEEGSETCAAVRLDYQVACCSAEFGKLRICYSRH